MRQRWVLILLVAVTSFFTGGWLLQQGTARDGNVYQHARLFDDVYPTSVPITSIRSDRESCTTRPPMACSRSCTIPTPFSCRATTIKRLPRLPR
jgi:hypothetical protein